MATDPSSTSSTSPSSTATNRVTCEPQAECKKCVAVKGCVFVTYKETSQICQLPSEVTTDSVQTKIVNTTESCPGSGKDDTTTPPTTIPPTTPSDPDTTTTSQETTTTTDTTTTTTTETTTTTNHY